MTNYACLYSLDGLRIQIYSGTMSRSSNCVIGPGLWMDNVNISLEREDIADIPSLA